MCNNIFFSIVMPTFNSAKTLDRALASIRNQKFAQETIEILVIDVGSTDETIKIAKRYNTVVVFNKDRVPEAAKRLGYQRAKGKWIIKQDSDEVYVDSRQLAKKKAFIETNPDVYCLLSDRLLPGKGCGISCAYLNYCGDPFSYIVYKLRGSIVRENREFLYKQNVNGNVYRYKEGDQYPIGDGGCTAFNIQKFREIFGDKFDDQEYVNLSTQKILEVTGKVGCIPGDNIYHYSNASIRSYLRKIRFKIHFNIYGSNELGYAARAKSSNKYNRRKWIFVLYAVSVILPIIDSIKLMIRQRDLSFLLHGFYTYYTLVITVIEIAGKVLKIGKGNYSYG